MFPSFTSAITALYDAAVGSHSLPAVSSQSAHASNAAYARQKTYIASGL
jgi:hypothetical protein